MRARGAVVLLVLVLAILLVVAGSASAAESTVTLKVQPRTVALNSAVIMSGRVTHASSASWTVTIESRTATGGWQRLVTAQLTSKHTYSVNVTLKKSGTLLLRARYVAGKRKALSKSAMVTVLAPPTLMVSDAGCSQDGTSAGWGVVLTNKSTNLDALEVAVTANLMDARGLIVASDTFHTNVVPAGTTYYVGGETSLPAGSHVVSVQAFTTMESCVLAWYRLPLVGNVRAGADSMDWTHVYGQVTNNLTGVLSSFAAITAVLFDSSGKVIGGGFTYPDTDIPPGASVAFDMLLGVECTPVSRIARVEATMENEAAD